MVYGGYGMSDSKLEATIKKHKLTPEQLEAVIDQVQNPQPLEGHVQHNWGGSHNKIGLLSDTHIGSKYFKPSVLDDVFKRFKAEKVNAVYHCGDMTEGYNRRKGHSFECNLHGFDEQLKGVVEMFPDIGVRTFFITGDHDSWHYENAGGEIGTAIARQRKDMGYLGAFSKTIDFTPKANITLMHPATGTAYAISYKPQKIVESLSGGEKPSILAIGHFHKIEYLFYRNIHTFQTGCIESQTPWMKRMTISAHVGAWILDVYTKKTGEVDKLEMKLLPYY
jgi:predicted phosphodiesterase